MQYLRAKTVQFILGLVVLLLLLWSMSAPSTFPSGQVVVIPEGMGLQGITNLLAKERVIRSAFWFRTFAILLGGERRMKAGEYYFDRPQPAGTVAWRVERGDHQIETIKVTIPEGFTVSEISAKFDSRFIFFDNNLFTSLADEGYLFPDTYFIPVTATATSTLKLFKDNFNTKIAPLLPAIERSGKTLSQIVTMASLIEAEANNQTDRELVSGVLWKRLKLGIPLQVDSEKGTYEFQGLPKHPINNPGLLSIEAAINATTTPYLYYLTGKDGVMHYSKTFEEHKQNVLKYLAN